MYLDLSILKVHVKKTAKDLSDNAYATFCLFFSDVLYKSICYGYSFELHRQVDAIQLGTYNIKGKRKVQGVPQSQTAALPRPQEEEETDKSKQAQTEQTYEKH